MANQTERDNQQVGDVHTTSMRWRVCFIKNKAWSSEQCEDSETFTSRNAAIKFGNDLGRADFREKYFGDTNTIAANIRIVEVGEYEKEVPWDEWCDLSKSIDDTIKELNERKNTEYQVWYTHTKGGETKDVYLSFNNFVDAQKEANRIRNQNRCYALALAMCGELKTDVRIQVVGPSSYIMEPSMWIVDEPFVVPEEYKKVGMTFFVEHSRVPKPTNFHDEASPMFVTDKFTTFEQARNFAMHLLNGDGPAYVVETGKTHWFFNINIYAVENDHRTLVPQDQWCDDVDAKEKNFSGILAYCSEVAGIKGERDLLRDELKRAKNEIKVLKAAIHKFADEIVSKLGDDSDKD